MDKLVFIGHGNTADVYEWGNGNCLKLFKPEFEGNAQKEYDITKQIMKINLRIPHAKEIIDYSCDVLSLEWRKRIISIFQSLSDESVLVHGDFHPLNIMLTEEGPFIIDWNNGSAFHPLADVALSSVILKVAGFPPSIKEDFHESYIKRYLQLSSFDYKAFLSWQIPLAVVRLSENKETGRDAIIKLIENNLQSLGH